MKQSFTLSSRQNKISLRTIIASDCENLRNWKNENRFAFFFQEIITPQMQEKWFREYWEREDDYMFIVQYLREAIGCMGYRLINGKIDIYNVILGKLESGGKGIMSQAIRLMCSHILLSSTKVIGLKVLRSNPALKWYLRNGFSEILTNEDFLDLELDRINFKPCEFEKTLNVELDILKR